MLGPALSPSAPLWAALDRLRLVLGLKEKVHQQYLRVGTLAKLQVRGGVDEEPSVTTSTLTVRTCSPLFPAGAMDS